jgi:hypothetical protein
MRLKHWLQIIVSLGLLAILVSNLDFAQARDILRQAQFIWIPALFLQGFRIA